MKRLYPGRATSTPLQAQVLYDRPAKDGGIEPCHGAPSMVWTQGWSATLIGVVETLTGETVPLPDAPGRDVWGVWTLVVTWVTERLPGQLAGRRRPVLKRGGDCDDFAVETLRRCLRAGFPRGALRLTYCLVAPRSSGLARGRDRGASLPHLVLTIETHRGTLVVDNLTGVNWLGAAVLRGHRFAARERAGEDGEAAPRGWQWETVAQSLEDVVRAGQGA